MNAEQNTGFMIITLKTYLGRLEDDEKLRPKSERRDVPTLSELATALKVSRATVTRLANGEINSLSFRLGTAILDELYRRGFEPNVNDILSYKPPAKK